MAIPNFFAFYPVKCVSDYNFLAIIIKTLKNW